MKKLIIVNILFVVSLNLNAQEKESSFVVYFENNQHKLNEKEQLKLNNFIKTVKNKKQVVKSIETFCDTVGSVEFNEILSDKRLKTISDVFGQKNIKVEKLISNGEMKDLKEFNIKDNSHCRKAEIIYIENTVIEKTVSKNKFSTVLADNKKINPIVLDIQFTGGTANVLPESLSEVNDLVDFLSSNKNVTALVRGHVCCSDNQTISDQRAYTIYKMLIDKGISPERLDFKGFSNKIPIAIPEITEEDQQRNRRVDVLFNFK